MAKFKQNNVENAHLFSNIFNFYQLNTNRHKRAIVYQSYWDILGIYNILWALWFIELLYRKYLSG